MEIFIIQLEKTISKQSQKLKSKIFINSLNSLF